MKRYLKHSLPFGLGVISLLGQSALAQTMPSQCAPRDAVLATLDTNYGEGRLAVGIAGQSNMMELFSNSETGTWTLLATSPDGQTCLIASGSHFETVRQTAPTKDRPA